MSNLREEMLKIKVKGFFNDGDLKVDSSLTALVNYHIAKARHNLETAAILIELSENSESKKHMKIRERQSFDEANRLFKLFFGLPRKASDNVGSESHIRKTRYDLVDD